MAPARCPTDFGELKTKGDRSIFSLLFPVEKWTFPLFLLELQEPGELHGEVALLETSTRHVTPFVVHHEEIAPWSMNEVHPKVCHQLVCRDVVLYVGAEEELCDRSGMVQFQFLKAQCVRR